MKNRLYILTLFALFFLGGCQDDDTNIPFGNDAELIVNLDIPDPVVVKTRAGLEDNFAYLWVLVFDKEGVYLSKHKGDFASGSLTNANYKFKGIPTTREGELLIFHFVANYDFTSFRDADYVGKSEAEVMNSLTVANGEVAYWQRVELPNGLTGAKGTTITLTNDISLLRNVAKVTVVNLTNQSGTDRQLTGVSFAIGNYIDKGTVAPYSTTTYQFVKGAVTEALDGNIVPITSENEFVSAQNGSGGASSEFKCIYERKNSTARNQTYIIIKGCFQNNSSETNTTPSYYKIDIGNMDAATLLDIERNYHYVIQINDVAVEGHPTLKEAMDNPASNNINAAIQVAQYTSVSDGINILQIEKAAFTFVDSGKKFQINYSYYDGNSGQINNSKITVRLEQSGVEKVIKDGTFTYSNGVISATTADVPDNNNIYTATFIVSDGNFLSRRITIRLRKPMNFGNVSVTPNGGISPTSCKVASMVGQPVTFTFSFPVDVSPEIFPLPIYIYSKKLSPDPTKEGIQPLSVDPKPNNSFRYVYMAPYLGNDANDVPIQHTVYLVTSTPLSNEDVILTSDYFNGVTFQIKAENIPALTNMKFTPNPILRRTDEPVVLTFDIPTVADNTLPYKVRIHTDYLDFVSAADGACVWDDTIGMYVYTTYSTGSKSISFKTKQAESGEYVRIDGDRFASTTVKRMLKMGEFKNVSVDISSGVKGSPVNLSFSFDEAVTYFEEGTMVYITTKFLEPAAGSNIIATGKPNEYKMYVATATPQTARFVMKETVGGDNNESIKLSANGIKESSVFYAIPGKPVFGSSVPGYQNRPVFVLKANNTPVSLFDYDWNTDLAFKFTIPSSTKVNGNYISSSNPLWVYLQSSANGLYLAQANSTEPIIWGETAPMSSNGYFTSNEFWFKITSSGDKTVLLNSRYKNSATVVTMMSVSGPGVATSDGLFETVTNIQDK